MPATIGTLPLYMRVGDAGEAMIGTVTLDVDQTTGVVTLTTAAVADALRAAADQIDPPHNPTAAPTV
ncbi:hypothetical protein [Streptomyces sp. SID3343]|uniref:hypothetical protein n=1 Tax=Streptomyces sp. SID3343 TaxID=2690260 RepID=UPI00136AEBBD|nr:hypothetical protein [Streptomyces sp. SID3343]MYW03476.1 hypothetical protein [Streptomyces sp. SID3343]